MDVAEVVITIANKASPFVLALIGVVVLFRQHLKTQAKVEALTERYHTLVTEQVKVLQDIADQLERRDK